MIRSVVHTISGDEVDVWVKIERRAKALSKAYNVGLWVSCFWKSGKLFIVVLDLSCDDTVYRAEEVFVAV